jgi:hypothetical protein
MTRSSVSHTYATVRPVGSMRASAAGSRAPSSVTSAEATSTAYSRPATVNTAVCPAASMA